MSDLPFDVHLELDGWILFWARLQTVAGHDEALRELRLGVAEAVRSRYGAGDLAQAPTVAALRRLFRAAGTDPTRYRPSSEALLRRLLKGDELPAIHPLVDVNNCLSAELEVPCCVMAEGSFTPPVILRVGGEGETMDSLRGPFSLEGKPVLADGHGAFGTPITDSHRVKCLPQTQRAWLVAYLPQGVVSPRKATAALERLLEQAPAARVEMVAATG